MAWFTNLLRRSRRPHLRQYHIVLPDGTQRSFDLERSATGFDLVDVSLLSMSVPSAHHNMFSLIVPGREGENPRWIRLEKPLRKEVKNMASPVTLHIQVLLYPRDHFIVIHRIAKHLLYSQICTDLKEGRIRCSNDVSVQLAGLIAQAQLGDYSERMLQQDYMTQLNVVQLSPRHERMAIEQHKTRRGLHIDECINEFLSIAETLSGYGSIIFNIQDDQDRPVSLACGPHGIEVLMGNIQTIVLHWEMISLISIRHRTLNFQTQSAYNQTGGEHSFRCPTSKISKQIGLICVQMRNHYCNSDVIHPLSRFRRFLSTRLPNKPRQHSSLHRKGSTVSSISAPSGYQNKHNSFSKPTNLSLVMSSDKPVNENNSFPSSSRISHIHSASSSSMTTPLIETSEELLQSPTAPQDSPTIRILPTLEEKELASTPPSLTIIQGEPPRKASTLPARVDPSDVFTLGANLSNNYIFHDSREGLDPSIGSVEEIRNQHEEIDNLDCITELLEEGLSKHQQYPYHHCSDHKEKQDKEEQPRERRRSDRGIRYDNGYKSPAGMSNNLPSYRSMTMQHKRHNGKYSRNGHNHSYHHYHQRSDPRQYHSASNLYHSPSNTRVGESVVTVATLATLSQDSSFVIDPHIRSLVYDSSQADTETEL